MRALLFGHLNHLPVEIIEYHYFKIGPWLRGEKNKRRYNGFFIFQENMLTTRIKEWKSRKYANAAVTEPKLAILNKNKSDTFLFSEIPHYSSWFNGLIPYRPLVIKLLLEKINPAITKKVNQLEYPCIGIHIRMGDFRKLAKDEEFGQAGAVRTPEKYFIDVINSIRNLYGSNLRVSIFSDGHKNELNNILTLPEVYLVEDNNDLVDLLLLSKSKIIVTSAGSSFSYWAGFISDAPLIKHPSALHHKIRTLNDEGDLYEGVLDDTNEVLVKKIKSI
jgi:hypothetical protein